MNLMSTNTGETETERERHWRERCEQAERNYKSYVGSIVEERVQAHERESEAMLQQWQRDRRQATTWPEALHKQAVLMVSDAPGDDDFAYRWFVDGSNACHYAWYEAWPETELAYGPQIEALQRKISDAEAQLAEVRAQIARDVADQVEQHAAGRAGWEGIAHALREYPEARVSEWLNW